MTDLQALVGALRASRGFAHKGDIGAVLQQLDSTSGGERTGVPNGDDCAALPDGAGGWQLLAIEGLVQDFVQASPWFAGYSAVMVNLSDVAAMGGRPTAVVDALWSRDDGQTAQLLAGMRAACERYGVPLVGGHTNLRSDAGQLAVAVLGHARSLISSFAARPGDRLLMAVDLRGHWHDPYPFWDASTEAPAARLREDLALLPALAEDGLCDAGKDISMAGVLGTALMLLECSAAGARIALDRLPCPAGMPPWQAGGATAAEARLRWLSAFPSFGYLLSVRPGHAGAVAQRFTKRGIACADIGAVTAEPRVVLTSNGTDGAAPCEATLWDFAAQPFMTGRRAA
ncbi:sll0787 family AIR synthase-like protein [Azohydromonas aeria]|uniref:sll0787 family AIR synthase-like protein n=1 Tax=Azohydromonas aeria TaxID=2590212 RepID=UPI0012FCA68C|nr:sll0787 family AIR synthase-like protein [Azohydromonas aeria]